MIVRRCSAESAARKTCMWDRKKIYIFHRLLSFWAGKKNTCDRICATAQGFCKKHNHGNDWPTLSCVTEKITQVRGAAEPSCWTSSKMWSPRYGVTRFLDVLGSTSTASVVDILWQKTLPSFDYRECCADYPQIVISAFLQPRCYNAWSARMYDHYFALCSTIFIFFCESFTSQHIQAKWEQLQALRRKRAARIIQVNDSIFTQ